VVGACDTADYDYLESTAVVNGEFVGLPLDDENQGHLTASRIEAWLEKIKPELK
jgi:flavodoxin I